MTRVFCIVTIETTGISEEKGHWDGNVIEKKYIYLPELLRMEEQAGQVETPPLLEGIFSPLSEKLQDWEALLQNHPNDRLRKFVLTGLEKGFHIGYELGHCHKASTHNQLLCTEHPEVVQAYIDKECTSGRLRGPFPRSAIPDLHVSLFGVIPKKASGKWRLIVDLSTPHGASVNDGISREFAFLSYVSVDMIADRVRSLRVGTLMAKLDIQSAFRIVPVHPADRLLLGMEWNGNWYVDAVLPFGLRSAPKLFNVIADAIQFIARSQGIQHVTHYLDDYIVLSHPASGQCQNDLQTLIDVCGRLGVPLAEEKIEGPTTRLEILGITIDSNMMQLSLPGHKMTELTSQLQAWQGKKTATKRDLQSLARKLQHAAKVVRPGRCFVRHLYGLTSVKGGPNQTIRLNRQARGDVQWWLTFMNSWNGVSLFWKTRSDNPDIRVWSDASGSWGCGALIDDRWLVFPWPTPLSSLSIAHKELIPIVIASFVWGKSWEGKIVQFNSNNQAVVTILTKLYCRDNSLMGYLRCLVFCAAKNNFWFCAKHTPGRENTLADAISRNRNDLFLSQAPASMKRSPDEIPPEVSQLLCLQEPDWLCPAWRRLFNYITQRA